MKWNSLLGANSIWFMNGIYWIGLKARAWYFCGGTTIFATTTSAVSDGIDLGVKTEDVIGASQCIMGFWIILAWRKTMSRPEFQKELKSIAWGLTRMMQIWQLALQHFGCRTMEKSCNYKHSRRSTQKEVVKCEKFGKWEVLDSIRQKWRYFCKKPTPNPLKDGSSVVRTIWAFCHLHCWTMRSKLNNQDEVPRRRCLWHSATADTMKRLCTIAQVNEESFELAYSSNLMLAKCGKFRNHSYSLQAFCTWSPELTHCPEPEKFCQGTCSMIFCFLLNGVLQSYRSCMVILLYTVTVWLFAIYPSTTTCVQSFHRTWPLSVAGAAKLGELARHVPQVWLQMFQTHDI